MAETAMISDILVSGVPSAPLRRRTADQEPTRLMATKNTSGNINTPGHIVSHSCNDQSLPQLADITGNPCDAENHQEYHPDLTP